jgi:hypothetical protein
MAWVRIPLEALFGDDNYFVAATYNAFERTFPPNTCFRIITFLLFNLIFFKRMKIG